MNFLRNSSVVCRRAIFALVIISSLSFAVFAQKSVQECKSYGCAGFIGEPINLKVVNADIRDILNYITEQYGINFVIDSSVKKEVSVTVNVNDVPWNLALDSILESQNLAVQVKGPILRVVDSEKLNKENEIIQKNREGQLDSASLYTEFIRLNYACAGKCASQTSFQGGSTGGGGGGGSDQGILGVVQKRLSRRGAVEVDSRSNTMIVTDVRENIDAIRQLVVLLDQPEPQVEIEARIVIASRNFSRDLGVQLSALVLGNGRAGGFSTLPNQTSTGTTDTSTQPTLQLPPPINREPNNNLASNLANTVVGLTTGIFGTAQINLLLTAGEQKGQAKIIATPRVTTLNNRKAEIESGTQIPVVTTQDSGNQTGSTLFTTTFVSVPLRLEVTPQITDLGTVVLDVVTENNSISSTISVGGVPGINTQRMRTQVTVPDGGTTVVGGAMLDQESDDQFRTPGLSKIPILGNLFKRKAVSRVTNEILFFITPRIFRPDNNGNQLPSRVSDGTRTTTLLQPVPLGNPQSNSTPGSENPQPQPQQIIVPIVPSIQPNTTPSTTKQP
jgi:type IV pilus assembly protein PilQ